MRWKNTFIAVLILFILASVLCFSTEIVPESGRRVTQNLFLVIAAVAAGIFGFVNFTRFGISTRHGRAVLFIAVGYMLWAIGEALWALLEYFGLSPYPSIADVFYLIAYPVILAGVIILIRVPKISCQKYCPYFLLGFLCLSAATVYVYGSIAYSADASFAENAVSLAYVASDLMLILVALMAFNTAIKFGDSHMEKFWKILSASFLAMWTGDMLYSVFYNEYIANNFFYLQIDYLYIASYLIAAYAFYAQIRFIDELQKKLEKKKL